MKIRYGFVSNSSSASFVLHTNFSVKEFKDILLKELPDIFKKENFKKEVENSIKKFEESIIRYKGVFNLSSEKSDKQYIEYRKQILKSLDNINNRIELLDLILEYNNREVEENQLGKACIGGFTVMWNDEEDMGRILVLIRDMLESKYGNKSYMIEVFDDSC